MTTVTCNLGPFPRYYGGPCPKCAFQYIFCNSNFTYTTVTYGTPPFQTTLTICYQECNIYCDTEGCKKNGCWEYYA